MYYHPEPLSNVKVGQPAHPNVTASESYFDVNSIPGHLASSISSRHRHLQAEHFDPNTDTLAGHDVEVGGWDREFPAEYQNLLNPFNSPRSQGHGLLDAITHTLPSSLYVPLSTTSVRIHHCNIGLKRDVKLPTQFTPDITPTYEELLSNDGTKRYRCQCGRKTKSVGDMRRHHESLMHSSKRKYGCLPCGRTFTRKDGLVRHEKSCKKKHNCAIGEPSSCLVVRDKKSAKRKV